jgi:hypothetical protein
MRSWSFVIMMLVACGGGTPAPTKTVVSAPPPDAAGAPWSYGDPIACTTADDCLLVSPGQFQCPGPCGFCPGFYVLSPRGQPAIKCPPRPPIVEDETMPMPQAPNCAACSRPPEVRAACRAGVCVIESR